MTCAIISGIFIATAIFMVICSINVLVTGRGDAWTSGALIGWSVILGVFVRREW